MHAMNKFDSLFTGECDLEQCFVSTVNEIK